MRYLVSVLVSAAMALDECSAPTSDQIQTVQQEEILKEGTAAVGMPAIRHFTERRLLKDILELRDQQGVVTYTYLFAEGIGKLIWICDSIGYGIPYTTQYTSPQKETRLQGYGPVPQADPNGLYSAGSAKATWVMCKDPHGMDVKPSLIEPDVIVVPFRLLPASEHP